MALTTIDDRGLKTPIDLLDNEKIRFGTNNDLVIEHDSNHSYISHNGQGDLFVQTDGLFAVQKYATTERLINANADGNVELFYDGAKKLETSSDGITVSGDVTVGSGNYYCNDNGKLRLGGSQDLEIYHNGTQSIIDDRGTGALIIRTDNALDIKDSDNVMMAAFNKDSDVKLYHDGSVKLETTSYGVLHQGGMKADGTGYFKVNDDGDFYAGNDEDLKIYHDGSNSYIDNSTGTFRVRGSNIRICDTSNNTFFSGESAGSKVYHNDAVKLTTSTTGVTVTGTLWADGIDTGDNEKLLLGDGDDLEIYHDGSNSYIKNATGGLNLSTGDGQHFSILGGENMAETVARFEDNGACKLYYDNTLRIETSSTGVTINGVCDATCFTGDSGTAYGYSEITGSNATVTTSWTQVDSNHEWALPGAGVYKLQATVRVRIDDVVGYIKARYNGTAGAGHAQMLFETNDSDTMYNSSCHMCWVYTATGADTVDLEFASSATSDGFSIQNDANGRNFMLWERIG